MKSCVMLISLAFAFLIKLYIRLGLAPVKGLCHSSIERDPESFSLNVLGEDFIVFCMESKNIKDLKRHITAKIKVTQNTTDF